MSEEKVDVWEYITTLKMEAGQLRMYAEQMEQQTDKLSDVEERKATTATLCAIEQATMQMKQSLKQIGKDREAAALILGMEELIASRHKTLDQFDHTNKI